MGDGRHPGRGPAGGRKGSGPAYPGRGDPARPSLRETVLDHVRAESAIRSQGGTLTIDTTQATETLIVIDLPAPPSN